MFSGTLSFNTGYENGALIHTQGCQIRQSQNIPRVLFPSLTVCFFFFFACLFVSDSLALATVGFLI